MARQEEVWPKEGLPEGSPDRRQVSGGVPGCRLSPQATSSDPGRLPGQASGGRRTTPGCRGSTHRWEGA